MRGWPTPVAASVVAEDALAKVGFGSRQRTRWKAFALQLSTKATAKYSENPMIDRSAWTL
jgi:hypothetical protein